MKDITTIRRTVATMANQLHKLGYSLSNAFKTAWRRIKVSMTCRVSGVTYGKRQELLQFITGGQSFRGAYCSKACEAKSFYTGCVVWRCFYT